VCGPLHGSADSVVVNYYEWFRVGRYPWSRWRVDTKRVPAFLVATASAAKVSTYPRTVLASVSFHSVELSGLRHSRSPFVVVT
jgi:hypothetical protein